MWQLKAALPSSKSLSLPDDFNSYFPNIVLIELEATRSLACRTRTDPFRALRTPVCLLSQETSHCPTERHFSSAIMCGPSKAHAFTVSAETQGPNSTTSLRTVGSFFKRKKKSSQCGPYFHGTFQCVEAVRKRTQGTVIINYNKVSQALLNSFSVSFTKAFNNSLDWAITISLLVCQQLERIDPSFQILYCVLERSIKIQKPTKLGRKA